MNLSSPNGSNVVAPRARVAVDALTKTFPIERRGHTLFRLLRRTVTGSTRADRFVALHDLTFDLRSGDRVGVVGDNGAGKTTLLKTLAGLLRPDSGTLRVDGVATLVSGLSIGMVDDLTVAENIELYGAIYGVDRARILSRRHDIVSWAELDGFVDVKLKRLSSGMKTRLAFSAMRHIDADVYLMDEVLTAGDRHFQQKCERVFDDYKASGKTFVIATHDQRFVTRFCTHALWLHKSRQMAFGDPATVVASYLESKG